MGQGACEGQPGVAPLHGRPGLVVNVQHDGLGVAGQVAACEGGRVVTGVGGMQEHTPNPAGRPALGRRGGAGAWKPALPGCRSSGSVLTTTWPSPPPDTSPRGRLNPQLPGCPTTGHTGAPAPPAWPQLSLARREDAPAWSGAAVPEPPRWGPDGGTGPGTTWSPASPLTGPASLTRPSSALQPARTPGPLGCV